jgi:hypothetical protein
VNLSQNSQAHWQSCLSEAILPLDKDLETVLAAAMQLGSRNNQFMRKDFSAFSNEMELKVAESVIGLVADQEVKTAGDEVEALVSIGAEAQQQALAQESNVNVRKGPVFLAASSAQGMVTLGCTFVLAMMLSAATLAF